MIKLSAIIKCSVDSMKLHMHIWYGRERREVSRCGYLLKKHCCKSWFTCRNSFFSGIFYIYFTSKGTHISGKFPSVTFRSSGPEETGASIKEITRPEDDSD